MDTQTLLEHYDEHIKYAQHLMARKNADYGASWEEMRPESLTDQILVKVRRIVQLEELGRIGQAPQVSEGIESELVDIINYCVMRLIKQGEK